MPERLLQYQPETPPPRSSFPIGELTFGSAAKKPNIRDSAEYKRAFGKGDEAPSIDDAFASFAPLGMSQERVSSTSTLAAPAPEVIPEFFDTGDETPANRYRTQRKVFVDGVDPSAPDNAPLFFKDKVDPLRPTAEQLRQVLDDGVDEPAVFTNASDGEPLNLADVKAREAAAAERNERAVAAGRYASGVAEVAAEHVVAGDPAFEIAVIEAEDGSNKLVEHAVLDTSHKVEVVVDETTGDIDSVTVIVGDSAEDEHSVTVERPDDEPTGEVYIDNEPVENPEEVITVAEIMRHTAEDLAVEPAPAEAVEPTIAPVEMEQVVETEKPEPEAATPVAERTPDVTKVESVESRFRGALIPYLSGNKTAEQMVRKIAAEQGVEPSELTRKISTGAFSVNESSVNAIRALIQHGARPNSPVWGTDPRANSDLGKAARQSNELLERTLREILSA